MWPPRQGPQVGGLMTAPASRKICSRPSSMAWRVDQRGGGDDDEAHPFGHLAALDHLGRQAQVFQPAVGAGADHRLVDASPAPTRDTGIDVARRRRAGHQGLQFADVISFFIEYRPPPASLS